MFLKAYTKLYCAHLTSHAKIFFCQILVINHKIALLVSLENNYLANGNFCVLIPLLDVTFCNVIV